MQELRRQNSLLLQLVKSLQSQINSKNQQNTLLFAQHQQLTVENHTLQSEISAIKRQQKETRKNSTVQEQPKYTFALLNSPRTDRLEMELTEMKKQLNRRMSQMQKLSKQNGQKQRDLKRLNEQLGNLDKKPDEQLNLARVCAQNKHLQKQLVSKQKQLKELTLLMYSKSTEATCQIKQAQQQINRLKQESLRLTETNNRLIKQLEQSEGNKIQIKILTQRSQTLQAKIHKLLAEKEQQVHETQARIKKEIQVKIIEKTEQLAQLQEQMRIKQSKIRIDMEQQLANSKRFEEITREIPELEINKEQLIDEIGRYKEEINRLQINIQQLRIDQAKINQERRCQNDLTVASSLQIQGDLMFQAYAKEKEEELAAIMDVLEGLQREVRQKSEENDQLNQLILVRKQQMEINKSTQQAIVDNLLIDNQAIKEKLDSQISKNDKLQREKVEMKLQNKKIQDQLLLYKQKAEQLELQLAQNELQSAAINERKARAHRPNENIEKEQYIQMLNAVIDNIKNQHQESIEKLNSKNMIIKELSNRLEILEEVEEKYANEITYLRNSIANYNDQTPSYDMLKQRQQSLQYQTIEHLEPEDTVQQLLEQIEHLKKQIEDKDKIIKSLNSTRNVSQQFDQIFQDNEENMKQKRWERQRSQFNRLEQQRDQLRKVCIQLKDKQNAAQLRYASLLNNFQVLQRQMLKNSSVINREQTPLKYQSKSMMIKEPQENIVRSNLSLEYLQNCSHIENNPQVMIENEELRLELKEKSQIIIEMEQAIMKIQNDFNCQMIGLRRQIAQLNGQIISLKKSLYVANPQSLDLSFLVKENPKRKTCNPVKTNGNVRYQAKAQMLSKYPVSPNNSFSSYYSQFPSQRPMSSKSNVKDSNAVEPMNLGERLMGYKMSLDKNKGINIQQKNNLPQIMEVGNWSLEQIKQFLSKQTK